MIKNMNQEPSHEANIWLQAFRHKIINLLLGSVTILGTFGLLINIYQEWRSGIGSITYISAYYLAAYIVVLKTVAMLSETRSKKRFSFKIEPNKRPNSGTAIT